MTDPKKDVLAQFKAYLNLANLRYMFVNADAYDEFHRLLQAWEPVLVDEEGVLAFGQYAGLKITDIPDVDMNYAFNILSCSFAPQRLREELKEDLKRRYAA